MKDEYITVHIQKPIYGTYCSIDKRVLVEAVREHKQLLVSVANLGSAYVDPQWWWDTKVKIEKRPMKYANSPMTFVFNHVPIKSYYKRSKEFVPDQLSLL